LYEIIIHTPDPLHVIQLSHRLILCRRVTNLSVYSAIEFHLSHVSLVHYVVYSVRHKVVCPEFHRFGGGVSESCCAAKIWPEHLDTCLGCLGFFDSSIENYYRKHVFSS